MELLARQIVGEMGPLAYVSITLIILWYLPVWGQRILAFRRDLDEYQEAKEAASEESSRT